MRLLSQPRQLTQLRRITTDFCRRFTMTAQGDLELGQEGLFHDYSSDGHVFQSVYGKIIGLGVFEGHRWILVRKFTRGSIRIPSFAIRCNVNPWKADYSKYRRLV